MKTIHPVKKTKIGELSPNFLFERFTDLEDKLSILDYNTTRRRVSYYDGSLDNPNVCTIINPIHIPEIGHTVTIINSEGEFIDYKLIKKEYSIDNSTDEGVEHLYIHVENMTK